MSLGYRITLILKHLGVTQKKFAESLKISPGNLSDWINPNRNSKPTVNVLSRIYELYKIDLTWLITGYGQMLNYSNEFIDDETCTLSILGEISAGNKHKIHFDYPKRFSISKSLVNNPDEILCYIANGFYLFPDINHSDIVLIRKCTNWGIAHDKVCAIILDNVLLLTKVELSYTSDLIRLTSLLDGDDYQPREINSEKSNVRIIGVLHSIIRKSDIRLL